MEQSGARTEKPPCYLSGKDGKEGVAGSPCHPGLISGRTRGDSRLNCKPRAHVEAYTQSRGVVGEFPSHLALPPFTSPVPLPIIRHRIAVPESMASMHSLQIIREDQHGTFIKTLGETSQIPDKEYICRRTSIPESRGKYKQTSPWSKNIRKIFLL